MADRGQVVVLASAAVSLPLCLVAEFASNPPANVWVGDLVPGLVLLGCGVAIALTVRRNAAAGALVAAGLLWFAANASAVVPNPPADLFASAIYLHRGLIVASLLLLHPGIVTSCVAGVAVASTLVTPLMNEPHGMLAWSAAAVAGGGLALLWVGGGSRMWGLLGLATLGATVSSVALITEYGDHFDAPAIATAVYHVGITLTAGFVLIAARAHRASPASVADAVVTLALGVSGSVRDQLARGMRDPALELAFAADDGWINELGQARARVVRRAGQERISVSVEGVPVAELSCRADIASAKNVLASVESATRLAALNATLRAELRREADLLRESRRRLLIVEDEARRGLATRLREGIDKPFTDLEFAARMLSTRPRLSDSVNSCQQRQTDLRAELVRLAAGLGPSALEDGGLRPSLESLTDGLGLHVTLVVPGDPLPREVETTVYLFCAEAVTNIVKHAHATSMELLVTLEREQLIAVVCDNGVGGASRESSTGITGIAHRLAALGGVLEVHSPRGKGTRLTATLDLARVAAS